LTRGLPVVSRSIRRACEFAALLAAALAVWGVPAAAAQDSAASRRTPIAQAIDEVVARYELPGIAVGVVVDGQIVYRGTRGELVAGGGDEIRPDTLFKIASNGKAMTTSVIARLVDAGKMRWDDPVTKHLPQFRMHDPWVTREMQVRDLLIHNSGLRAGAGDLMLWPEPNLFTREDVIRGLRHLKPIHSFRSHYAYDNLLYIVAGEAAAAAAGTSYEALLQREVFAPLALDRCRVGAWRRGPEDSVAQPHRRADSRNVPFKLDGDLIPATTMAAAGGVRCSLDDMLKWIRAWLDPGTPDATGKPWLSAAQRHAMWTAHTPMPLTPRMRQWDRSHFNAYGYGWRLTDVDGTAKVSHTGTLGGMYSAVTLLPERNTGFVLLINGDADEARTVLNQALVKQFTAPRSDATIAHYAARIATERAEPSAAPTSTVPRHGRCRCRGRFCAFGGDACCVMRDRGVAARRGELLDQCLIQYRARLVCIAVDQQHEAGVALRQQRHRRIHPAQRAGVGHLCRAIDIGQPPAVAVGIEVAAIPLPHPRCQRHGRVRGPHRMALRGAEPRLASRIRRARIEPGAYPFQHVVEAAAHATGRRHGRRGDQIAIEFERDIAAVGPAMRLGDRVLRAAPPGTDPTAIEGERCEHFALQQRFVRGPGCRCCGLAGDDVEQVVVGVMRAEAVDGLEVPQATDHILARKQVRLRPQHQVPGAGAQAAVVDQQVADLHLAGDPRVMHAELRQMFCHRIVPTHFAGVDQPGDDARGHRLAVGGNLEQRVGADLVAAASNQLAARTAIDDLPVDHHTHGDAR